MIYKLSDESIKTLIKNDRILGMLINTIGDYTLNLNNDYFRSIVYSIIGQQLSIKAKQTIIHRFNILCNNKITPEIICSLDIADMRNSGISYKKISYIQGLSQDIINNKFSFNNINALEDIDILQSLTSIKGVGKWTAQMFMIFSLGKSDIFSFDDIGLQRAIKWLYKIDTEIDHSLLEKISNKWIPYRSVASLYLWEIVNRNLINTENTFI